MGKYGEQFDALVAIIARLRDPNGGCPWDLEQTHASLKQYLIEEAYETLDAIDHEPHKLSDELGDVLLQVLLHSQIGAEENRFDIGEVISKISEKMVRRHPHVFGATKVSGSSEVLQNWEATKQKELPKDKSIVDGTPRAMPALQRAQRTGEKVARVGFEWPTLAGVRDKVLEEMREFLETCCEAGSTSERRQEEFGDILFALVQLARRLDFNAEELLQKATDKFIRRFKEVERRAGPKVKELGLEKLDALWEEVKKEEKSS